MRLAPFDDNNLYAKSQWINFDNFQKKHNLKDYLNEICPEINQNTGIING